MKHITVYTKLLLVIGLTAVFTLTACQTNTPATPTPLAAATSQSSHTPVPTIEVMETAVPTSTPSPTATQTATPTPFLAVSAPILSSQGQLAFIKNQTLFVETAVNTGTFSEIHSSIASASWSPQGDKLLLETCDLTNQAYCLEPIWLLFHSETNSILNLSDTILNLPSSYLGTPRWMQNGEKILFWEIIEGTISILDLKTSQFSTPIHVFMAHEFWELPNENLMIQDRLGSRANELHVYDLDGKILWSFPNTRPWGIEGGNAGVLGFSESGKLLVILEPDEKMNEFAVFYRFDPETFEIESHYSYQIVPATSVEISPDGNFIAMHVQTEQEGSEDTELMIIDRWGFLQGQHPNNQIVDWRLSSQPTTNEIMSDGLTRLTYWIPGAPVIEIITPPNRYTFISGKWSEDGRFFIYSTVDEAATQSHLTLWQTEASEPTLLATAEGIDGFQNFAWLPDSTAVYFNFGRTELWKFEVATHALSLIANAEQSE